MSLALHLSMAFAVLATAAESPLRITNPTNGMVVNPGQTIQMNVSASGGAAKGVGIIGWDRIGMSNFLTSRPYQFGITIPPKITPGLYLLAAAGGATG